MVGKGILPNNMGFPSPKYYTIFWRITIYSDTLHWWDITPIFDPLLILTLLPNFSFYQIGWGFHRTFETGAACQQRTLTPPDTWSCPTFGLACILMSRPISPEPVLFPDFEFRTFCGTSVFLCSKKKFCRVGKITRKGAKFRYWGLYLSPQHYFRTAKIQTFSQ